MKKFTSVLTVFAMLAMVGSAFASGAGAGAGAGAGGASGSGAGAPGGAAAGGTGGPGSGAPGTAGSGAAGTGIGSPGSDGSNAAAGTTGSPATGMDRSRAEPPKAGSTGSSTGVTGGTSSPAASPATASTDYTGRHTMEGEVLSVNQKKGHLKLKTAEGHMDLHFPASALASVKKGDRISVELAMKPAGSASMKHDKSDKGAASPKMDKK